MRKIRAKSWEDLESQPEGEWVEVVGGLDLKIIDLTTRGRNRVVVPLNAKQARALRPRKGDVLVATVRGRKLQVERQKPKRPARG